MSRSRLLWKLYPTYLIIIVVCIGAVGFCAWQSVESFYLSHVARDLEIRARLVEKKIASEYASDRGKGLDALCKDFGRRSDTRLTIIARSGVVLGDSEKDPNMMENHAARPEIITALATGRGQAKRYSPTLEVDFMYVALPLQVDGETVGVIRTSVPVGEIDAALKAIWWRIVLTGLVVAVLAAGGTLVVARRISRPLEEMKEGADRFAKGQFSHKLAVPDVDEFAALADALNRMAGELDEKIRTISRQGQQQQAMLASMIEGVIAVDRDEHVIALNRAAAIQLGLSEPNVMGRSVHEAIRNADLATVIANTLASGGPSETEIVLPGEESERVLQAHGTVLRGSDDEHIGALVVLHDVTRLRQLETVRRDFVASVSHELKTPITSIKGFVETLCGPAADDPGQLKRFLEIIQRQVDRLNAIIDDLLSLSRIEQEDERSQVERTKANLNDVLAAAVAECDAKARERRITARLDCPDELIVPINPQLIEQAVVNLLDNAIKYSDEGGTVDLRAEETTTGVVIHVADTGCGIAAEHLPRVFERFYRVDRARSRKLGGTGLGLAIVKHIAHAHGGTVTAESTPGQGSTFTIHLPRA